MRRVVFAVGLGTIMALVSSSAADDTKDTSPKKDSPKKAVKEKPIKTDSFTGKLIRVEGSQRTLAVRVTAKIPQENTGAAQNLANLKLQLLTARDPNSIRNITVQMAQNQANLVNYKDQSKDVELEIADDLKVRTLVEPIEYDDKGKPRRLTAKEKAELKGPDPKLPGYEADFDNLKVNQTVTVYVPQKKSSGKSNVKDLVFENKQKLKAVMVVIVKESPK
jgi:flagellar basal body-associated protein FliL